MALRFAKGDDFAGYKVERVHLSDDGIERYEVRPKDGLTRALLHCAARDEQDSPPRDVALEAIALRLAAIDDPGLPRLIEARKTDQFPWVVTEYPPKARKLSTALQGTRFESIANAFGLIDAIAALLERARERGFVHGRLHPGLIWFDERNRLAKVYDLGFAEIFGPMPLSCPQRYCLAPEQIKGAPASERSDIYTLGVILYELLAGHPIFMTEEQAPSREKMIDLILTREPAALASIRPLPTYIDEFVFRAMAKREAERFADWGAFRSALQAVAARYLREAPSSGPVAAPDSSEPSDPDRVQRDTLESAPSADPPTVVIAAGDLPPPSPPEAPHNPPVELPPASPAVVPRPTSPAAELPTAPELPGPTQDEVPAPPPPRMPTDDQERLPRQWRQRRKKKEPIAAIAAAALLIIVVLSIAAVWRDAPRSARVDAPPPMATAAELVPPVMLLPHAPAPIASSASSADKERARALVLQATEAVFADQLTKAEALLRAAWQLEKTYDIAGNLGHVELTNGKPRDAADHLRFCLATLPPSEGTKQRDRVQRRFDEARRLVAALRISVDVPGTEVSIDGALVGISPLGAEVFVDPGDRVVTARLAGYNAEPAIVVARAGATYDVTLRRLPGAPAVAELPPAAPPGHPPAPAAPPAAPEAPAAASTSAATQTPAHAAAKAPHGQRGRPAEPAPSSSVSPEVAELRALYQYAPPPDEGR
jgi:serine/threonine protein kinase